MLARRIIAKHVTRTTALAMLGATAVLSSLQVLFTYLGELGELKDGYGAWDAFLHVLWGAPNALYEILPISALIGAVLGLGTLASNSELIVMRSVGVSLWRIVGWVMRSALLLVVLSFALSEWVIPYTNEKADSIKSHRSASSLTFCSSCTNTAPKLCTPPSERPYDPLDQSNVTIGNPRSLPLP